MSGRGRGVYRGGLYYELHFTLQKLIIGLTKGDTRNLDCSSYIETASGILPSLSTMHRVVFGRHS